MNVLRIHFPAARHALALLTLVLAACSTVATRPAALDDARIAVDAARANPQVTDYAAGELRDAVAAYDRAEVLFRNEGDSEDVRHLGYLARQRAAIAQETARMRYAEQAITSATAERERVRLAARAAEAEAATRAAQDAQLRAESARRAAADSETIARVAQQQAQISQQNAAIAQQQALDAQQRNAVLESELRELAATRTDRGLVVTLNDVLFDTGSAQLRPGGQRLVARLADFLREYPERTLAIEGFTDSVGGDTYNQELSERRAASVRVALIESGIDGSRIYVRGYGKAFPVASNDTAEGRQRNRRVEVVISDASGSIGPRVATYVPPIR
ncbi:MAG TPA: OmpA family protein [Casimicrobiaceae bacterium]|nr:OmpA family protein [Casimicrobiaceae bacterium]